MPHIATVQSTQNPTKLKKNKEQKHKQIVSETLKKNKRQGTGKIESETLKKIKIKLSAQPHPADRCRYCC